MLTIVHLAAPHRDVPHARVRSLFRTMLIQAIPRQAFQPKVQLAFEVPSGTVPRRVQVERDRRSFKLKDIAALLQSSHGITSHDLLPCGDIKRAPAPMAKGNKVSTRQEQTCPV